MVHLFPSTQVLMHCIPVQDITAFLNYTYFKIFIRQKVFFSRYKIKLKKKNTEKDRAKFTLFSLMNVKFTQKKFNLVNTCFFFAKGLNETPFNEKLSKFNKRNSISLPDIPSASADSHFSDTTKSAATTPSKAVGTHANTPIKLKKKNISIIFEDREKENPNYAFKCASTEVLNSAAKPKATSGVVKQKKETVAVECREVGIQCNKMGEDMLMGETVEKTNYWKLMAHKRYRCLVESLNENKQVCIYPLNLIKV